MKSFFLTLFLTLLLVSCGDDSVRLVGTTKETFEESITKASKELEDEDKLREAVRLIFNHDSPDLEEDVRWSKVRSMLNRKTAEEVFAIAESVAASKGIPWTRNTPSGTINLLKVKTENEVYDPNNENVIDYASVKNGVDVKISAKNYDSNGDGIQDGISISPNLIDVDANTVSFTNVPLLSKIMVQSNGTTIYQAKTIFSNSGQNIQIPYSKLASVTDDMVDIHYVLELPQKGFKTQLTSVAVNYSEWKENAPTTAAVTTNEGAKATVQKFFSHISTGNYKSAYDLTNNPKWYDYEKFKSPTLGYGSVKKIDVYSNEVTESKSNKATVTTSYKATDPTNGDATIKQSFSLEKRNDIWVIVGSKVISRVNE